MGTRLSKRVTVTLIWNYTDLDQAIIKDAKRAFLDFGYYDIRHDEGSRRNKVSGRIRLNRYCSDHKSRLESIPQSYGATGVSLQVVNPETDLY